MRHRKTNPRTDPRDKARIYDQDAAADWNLNANRAPIRYDPAWSRTGLVVVDSSPNVAEPAPNLVIPASEPLGAIGFFVVITAAATFNVWRKTGLTTAGLGWVRIHQVVLGASDSNVEQYVETGFGDVFVQVAAGAAGGTPVALHVGAA